MKRRALLVSGIISILIFGLVGTGLFLYAGGFAASENESTGYFEVENWENRSVNVTPAIVDLQTDNRTFEAELTLGVDGEERYFSSDWPSMTDGKHQLTVIVDEDLRNSYEFAVGEDGTGPSLSVGITEEEIRFSLESGGLSVMVSTYAVVTEIALQVRESNCAETVAHFVRAASRPLRFSSDDFPLLTSFVGKGPGARIEPASQPPQG